MVDTFSRRALISAMAAAGLAAAAHGQEPDPRPMLGVGGGDMADADSEHRVRYYVGPLEDRPAAGVAGRVWEVRYEDQPDHADNGRTFYDDGGAWDEIGRVPAPHDHSGDTLKPDRVEFRDSGDALRRELAYDEGTGSLVVMHHG